MSITEIRLPWEVNWGKEHGDVVPKDIIRLVLNYLEPYQLLMASRVNSGWKKQVDEEWGVQHIFCNDSWLAKVRIIWKSYTENKSYTEKEVENLEQISLRMRTVCGFTNEKFIEVIARYRNLFSRFQEFDLAEATRVFHQNFGMKKETITKLFLSRCPTSLDIQLGSLNYLSDLSIDAKQEFVRTCIESNRVELVLTHMDAVTTYEQKNLVHDFFIDLMSSSPKNLSKMLYKRDLEVLLKDFFSRAQKELADNPNSRLSSKLKPVIDSIHQGASDSASNEKKVFWGISNTCNHLSISFMAILEFSGWNLGWSTIIRQYFLNKLGGYASAFAIGTFEYYQARSNLIFQMIPLLPEYTKWENEISHLYDLYEILLTTRFSLDEAHFCSLSQKLLIHAVRAPDGKIYDLDAIDKELDQYPNRYRYTEKDLVPDFKKINKVYDDLIHLLRKEVEKKQNSLPPQNLNAFTKFLTFSKNFTILQGLLKAQKRRSYQHVYLFCIKKHKEYLKSQKESYFQGVMSKENVMAYERHERMKDKINFEYRYLLT